MGAELIVMNGPEAGRRFPIEHRELMIGRAPNAHVVLHEPEVGWRHCEIKQRGDRFVVCDLKTSAGTHVNGIRSAERWLENKDQIAIGKTVFQFCFSNGQAGYSLHTELNGRGDDLVPEQNQSVLLAACSLVFLFRALGASMQETQTKILIQQIVGLVSDLVPSERAFLLLGTDPAAIDQSLINRDVDRSEHLDLIARVCQDGVVIDEQQRRMGVPLYAGNRLHGVLLLQRAHDKPLTAGERNDLAAIASLASAGFEANNEVQALQTEKALLQEQIRSSSGIVGVSQGIRQVLARLERLAPLDVTVLITGENGTGKELIARALHEKSERRHRPFVPVNCAALSENLFESELFGHEKGAFTGAVALKRGRFELADGGTIFLDEVGEIPLHLQAKLLRVLEDRKFERVGGTQLLPSDIRVVSATNRDLKEDVAAKRFREDLYHRINVIELKSPPLRERQEDIPELSNYFLKRACVTCKRSVEGISEAAMNLLLQYSWPGNIRELRNAMERAVAIGVSDCILPEDLPESVLESCAADLEGARYHSSVSSAKRDTILDAYRQGEGDYKQAAALLGLHPNYLLRLVRNMNLRDEIRRQTGSGKRSDSGTAS